MDHRINGQQNERGSIRNTTKASYVAKQLEQTAVLPKTLTIPKVAPFRHLTYTSNCLSPHKIEDSNGYNI